MKSKAGKKTFLIVVLSAILIVSLGYLSRQGVREGMEDNKEDNKEKKREPFRGREALDAGCYSGTTYLGTGTGIIDCQQNYPGQSATYKSK